jgi:hypothetical protein
LAEATTSSTSSEANGAVAATSDSTFKSAVQATVTQVQAANAAAPSSNITPVVGQAVAATTVAAMVAATSATVAATPAAATSTTIAATPAAASGAALPPVNPMPTATSAITLANDTAKTPPGGLPAYAGGTFLNIPSLTLQDFLATLVANLSANERQAAGLQDLKNFNFSPQISATATAEQVVTYYQEEGKKVGYTINLTSLRNDAKLNASWLLLEKSGTRLGILVLEFKDTSESDALFGAGKLEAGKTVFFFTLL